jgi:phosphodiesterase/alkaline phosphatase D-like protein
MYELTRHSGYLLLAACAYLAANAAHAGFPNGVSSGDVDSHSAVIWARSDRTGELEMKVYEADRGVTKAHHHHRHHHHGRRVWGREVRVTDPAVPVKFAVDGLRSGTEYRYRLEDASDAIMDGRFRTADLPGAVRGLHFGVAGDWRGELAPYPAIKDAAASDLDFMVKLGDTIYADFPSPALDQPQAITLSDYRIKQNEVYSARNGLNFWANLQATMPIYAMIDDHEVMNDMAGGAPAASDPRFPETTGLINQTGMFTNGLRAFSEFNAIADHRYPVIGDPRTDDQVDLYRERRYGDVAATFMVDARSFRDQELPPVTNPLDPQQVGAFLLQSFDPTRTMLSQRQLQRLFDGLMAAQAEGVTWKFIFLPEPIQNIGVLAASDRYEGYAAERTELLQFIDDNAISNVVFVSADIHGTLVNNLTYQLGPFQPQIKTSAFEVVAPSVAFDAPFGPTAMDLAATITLAPGFTLLDSFLMSLGVPDMAAFNALPEQVKNQALEGLVNQQIVPMGYDPLGIEAGSGVDAHLLQGSYTAVFNYGWTEFWIDPVTQALTVTIHGLAPYTAADMAVDPVGVTARTTHIVGQFEVTPR